MLFASLILIPRRTLTNEAVDFLAQVKLTFLNSVFTCNKIILNIAKLLNYDLSLNRFSFNQEGKRVITNL